MHRHRLTLMVAALLATAVAAPAAEAKPKPAAAATKANPSGSERLGEFGAWQAFSYSEAGGKVCYATAAAGKTEGGASGRLPSYLAVTHRPASKNEVSLIGKYLFKPDSDAELGIDAKKYPFFTKGDSAWSKQANADKDIVAALAKGDNATIRAVPAKGKPVVDSFSLKGFGKALAAIDKACGVKRAPAVAAKPVAKPAAKKTKK